MDRIHLLSKQMSLRLSILLASLLFLQITTIRLYGQQSSNYQYFGVENGLPTNLIKCIVQDKKGLMWMGTQSGVIRFDGKTFLNVSEIAGCNFSSPIITSLLVDNDSTIIVATAAGVSSLNTEKFVTTQLPVFDNVNVQLPSDVHLLKTSDGSIYFVLNKKYIVRRNPSHTFEAITIDGQTDNIFDKLRYITEDDNGVLWAVLFDGDVLKKKLGEKSFKKHTTLNFEVNGLAYTKKHGYLVSSISGLYSFDPKTNATSRIFEPIKSCSLIYEDANGDVWIGYEYEKLYKLGGIDAGDQTSKIKLIDTYNYQINSIHKDPQSNVWVATNFGLVKYIASTPVFATYFTANTKQIDKLNTSTRVLTEDLATGDLYFAAYSGTFRINNATQKIDSIWLDKDYPYIPYTIIYDNGKLWIGTEGNGLYSYNVNTKERKQYYLLNKPTRGSPETLFIRFMYKLRDGKILICDYDQLILFNPFTEECSVVKYKYGNNNEEQIRALHIIEGRDGNLWVAAENGIFILTQKGGVIERIEALKTISGNQYKCIAEQDETYIWFGTDNEGIVGYNKKNHTTKTYTIKNGLVSNRVNAILINSDDNLWISTQNGLSYFNTINERFTNFKVEDGLITNEFNTSSFLKTSKNELIFGSINGFISIPADFVPKPSPSSNLVWSKVYLYNPKSEKTNYWLANGGEINVPYYNSFFELNFALTNYVNPEHNTYYYRIRDVIDEWQSLGNQNVLRFNELPAGNYEIEIMAYGNNNNASTSILTMKLLVDQAYYKTWWFICLVVMGFIGLGYLIFAARMRQLKMVTNLRMTISSDLHDDVGSVLTRIAMQAEYARTKPVDKLPDVLTKIADYSRSAVSNMRDVIWATDVRNDKALNLLDRMREHAESMLGESRINYTISPNLGNDILIKMNVRQHVFLIYKEALNNIVKHSNATNVIIRLEDNDNSLKLYIKDNGVGNNNNLHHSGSGLANMRLRAKKLNAQITINDESGYEIVVVVKSYKQNKFWKKLIWKN